MVSTHAPNFRVKSNFAPKLCPERSLLLAWVTIAFYPTNSSCPVPSTCKNSSLPLASYLSSHTLKMRQFTIHLFTLIQFFMNFGGEMIPFPPADSAPLQATTNKWLPNIKTHQAPLATKPSSSSSSMESGACCPVTLILTMVIF